MQPNLEKLQSALKIISIKKVIAHTGLSRTTITDIRDGKNLNPTIDTIMRISKFLEESGWQI
jgi:DNA-binding Xre family transcriptional regulator